MTLNEDIKQKITKRFLRDVGKPESKNMEEIYLDLLNGEHTIEVTISGKYTIAEVMYYRNEYKHHFVGVSSRNPKDTYNMYYGLRNSVEDALTKLLEKFYNEEI